MDFDIVENNDRLSIIDADSQGSVLDILKRPRLCGVDDQMKAILLSVFEAGYSVGRQVEKYDDSAD